MASNTQKTHFSLEQNRFAQQKALQQIEKLGKGLPCSVVAVAGSIVTVTFQVNAAPFTLPQVTMPVATSHYFFQPIQIGDTGTAIPADVYLGGISGLGGGTPDLTLPANLSALQFLPTANADWTPTDPNKAEIFGPAGSIIRNGDGTVSVTVSDTAVTIVVGSKTWTFTAAGLTLSNAVIAETHIHEDPQGGTVGPPINP